jgi:hypothetical protein
LQVQVLPDAPIISTNVYRHEIAVTLRSTSLENIFTEPLLSHICCSQCPSPPAGGARRRVLSYATNQPHSFPPGHTFIPPQGTVGGTQVESSTNRVQWPDEWGRRRPATRTDSAGCGPCVVCRSPLPDDREGAESRRLAWERCVADMISRGHWPTRVLKNRRTPSPCRGHTSQCWCTD